MDYFSRRWDEREKRWNERWLKRLDRTNKNSLSTLPPLPKEQLHFEEMKLPREWKDLICLALDWAHPEDSANEDFRLYLTRLRPVIDKTSAIMKFTDDPNTFFSCYLVNTQFRAVQKVYEGHEEKFYVDNSGHIKWFKERLGIYIDNLIEHFGHRDHKQVVKDTANFWYAFSLGVPGIQDILTETDLIKDKIGRLYY